MTPNNSHPLDSQKPSLGERLTSLASNAMRKLGTALTSPKVKITLILVIFYATIHIAGTTGYRLGYIEGKFDAVVAYFDILNNLANKCFEPQ